MYDPTWKSDRPDHLLARPGHLARILCTLIISGLLLACSPGWAQDQEEPGSPLNERQKSLAVRYQQLEKMLEQMAQYMWKTDPERAELLMRAIGQSKQNRIGDQMEQIARLLEQEQLGEAFDQQGEAVKILESLFQLLQSQDRLSEIESEQERIEKILKELKQIAAKEKNLHIATERGGDMKRLSEKQSDIAEQNQKLSEEIQNQDQERNKEEDGENSAENDSENSDANQDPNDNNPTPDPKQQDQQPGQQSDPQQGQQQQGQQQQGQQQQGQQQQGQQQQGQQQQGQQQQGQQQQDQQQQDQQQQGQQQQGQQQEQQDNTPGREEIEQAQENLEKAIEKLKEEQREEATEEQRQRWRSYWLPKKNWRKYFVNCVKKSGSLFWHRSKPVFAKCSLCRRRSIPEPRRSGKHRLINGPVDTLTGARAGSTGTIC
ncbi:MAG: hypothetical protein R3C11_18080 [Planctomycetaceae bacterium]